MLNEIAAARKSATILAIDDNEDNLALLDSLLSSKGFSVSTASDGPAGIALALARRPDLILLDLAMPGMDGFAVLERLRKEVLTARTPVIVLTANYREANMVERGLALGATEYLTKPIQHEELVVRIRSALRLATAEREIERLRRDFASMLVHDMRGPLDGIRLTLGVLRRHEPLDSPRWALLDSSLGSLEGLGRLMDDLLHANRLEDEGFVPQSHPLTLSALIERSIRDLRPVAEESRLTLVAETAGELPLVMADPALLKRVLDNLVGNAIKFTEVGTVSVGATLAGDMVRVTVTDTGQGIPRAALARIFDRYYHLERRSEARQGGFGLGLAFCERAVMAMGGRIGADSEEGQGSTFWFTLPAVTDR